jgi:Holliday junction resolvasome RuvABC endonuclease subunit
MSHGAPVRPRLLAVDPSLTHTGFLTADILGFGRLAFLEGGTVMTSDQDPLALRLAALREATETWLDMARGRRGAPAPDVYVVIEDPFFQSDHARRLPKTTHVLGAAFGAIASTAAARFSADVRAGRVLTVPVGRYYPRVRGEGARATRREVAIQFGRRLLPQELSTSSEHVCMAAVLAHWWAHNTAARLFAVPGALRRPA